MTDEEYRKRLAEVQESHTANILSEILRLLVKLFFKILKRLLKFIIKAVIHAFELFKIILQDIIDFWNDNSTQEKIKLISKWIIQNSHSFWLKTKKISKAIVKYVYLGLKYSAIGIYTGIKYTILGIVWTAKAIFITITNLKPTLLRFAKWIKENKARQKRISIVKKWKSERKKERRKAAIQQLKEKGVKGILFDYKNSLRKSIDSYIDDEQDEESEEIANDTLEEEIIEEKESSNNAATKITNKINTFVKDILNDEK